MPAAPRPDALEARQPRRRLRLCLRETAARATAGGAPLAPPRRVPYDAMEVLLAELLDGEVASSAPPQLPSTGFSTGEFAWVRHRGHLLLAQHNAQPLPDGIALSQTPGAAAAAVMALYCFSAAWTRFGDRAVAAASECGIGWGARAALVRKFMARRVHAGYTPGLPEARTWGQVLDLAASEADAAAAKVARGAASPLSLFPPLPEEIIGSAPGSQRADALVQALGPYALFARQRTPRFWADAAAQPALPRTLAAPQADSTPCGFSEDAALPPYSTAPTLPRAGVGGAVPDPYPRAPPGPALGFVGTPDPTAAAAAHGCTSRLTAADAEGAIPMEAQGLRSAARAPALAARLLTSRLHSTLHPRPPLAKR